VLKSFHPYVVTSLRRFFSSGTNEIEVNNIIKMKELYKTKDKRYEEVYYIGDCKAHDDDMSCATIAYGTVAEEKKSKTQKIVMNLSRYTFPKSHIPLRVFTQEQALSAIMSNNDMRHTRIKGLMMEKDKASVEMALPLLWNNVMNVRQGSELKITPAKNKDIRYVTTLVESGELRDQVTSTRNNTCESLFKVKGRKQRLMYQCIIPYYLEQNKVGAKLSLFQLYSAERCALCNEIAKRFGGHRVKRTRDYAVPQQWMFETAEQSLSYFVVATLISLGTKRIFESLQRSGSKPHNRRNRENQQLLSQMTNKERAKRKDRMARMDLPNNTLQTTSVVKQTGESELPYLHLITDKNQRSLLILALPDRRTVEKWKRDNKQPKPSAPGNYDNTTLYIDTSVVSNLKPSLDKINHSLCEYEHVPNNNIQNDVTMDVSSSASSSSSSSSNSNSSSSSSSSSNNSTSSNSSINSSNSRSKNSNDNNICNSSKGKQSKTSSISQDEVPTEGKELYTYIFMSLHAYVLTCLRPYVLTSLLCAFKFQLQLLRLTRKSPP
jgi:hypothetical protein